MLDTKAGLSVRDQQLLVSTRNFLHISLQIHVWISQNSDQDRQLFQLSPEHWPTCTNNLNTVHYFVMICSTLSDNCIMFHSPENKITINSLSTSETTVHENWWSPLFQLMVFLTFDIKKNKINWKLFFLGAKDWGLVMPYGIRNVGSGNGVLPSRCQAST